MQDMADQLGVSLRDLMAGIMTGRFSEHVTEDDIVHGDKGDPLFFRLDQNRAFGICGSDLPEVEKDMSTVEEMSRGGSVRNVQTDSTQESGQVPAGKSGGPPQKTGSPPAETGEDSGTEEAGAGLLDSLAPCCSVASELLSWRLRSRRMGVLPKTNAKRFSTRASTHEPKAGLGTRI
jgi:hypothetical protein